MLHASETWPLTKTSLQHSDRSSQLLAKLEFEDLDFEDLDVILSERRLRWFGPVERSSGAVRTACDTGWRQGGPS